MPRPRRLPHLPGVDVSEPHHPLTKPEAPTQRGVPPPPAPDGMVPQPQPSLASGSVSEVVALLESADLVEYAGGRVPSAADLIAAEAALGRDFDLWQLGEDA